MSEDIIQEITDGDNGPSGELNANGENGITKDGQNN